MLIIACLLTLTFTVCNVQGRGLFSSQDDVVILDNKNFNKTVFGSKQIWCILFYADWCGHCQHFAPEWKALAHDTKGWSTYVRIGVVDCPLSQDLCRKYNIEFYPSIQTFKPFSKSEDKGTEIQSQDIETIRHTIVTRIKNETNFADLKYHDLDIAGHDAYLVFDKPSSYVATELALDFSSFAKIQIAKTDENDKNHESLKSEFSVKSVPAIFRIQNDGSFQQPIASPSTRQSIKTSLQKIYHITDHVVSPKSKSNSGKATTTNMADDRYVYMEDLTSTLTFMFMNEIPNRRILHEKHIAALESLISVLEKFFPFLKKDKDQFKQLFANVRQRIQNSKTKLLTGIAVQQSARQAGLRNHITWIGCKGSRVRYRGFPCGLWTLFHTLTAYAYKYETKSPRLVLQAMTDYIRFFFGCKFCSDNFVKESLSIQKKVHMPKDAVMWLWETHNRVNKRLHGDPSEDPTHQKLQFPPTALCKTCHTQSQNDRNKWDNGQVLEYLVQRYFSDIIIQV